MLLEHDSDTRRQAACSERLSISLAWRIMPTTVLFISVMYCVALAVPAGTLLAGGIMLSARWVLRSYPKIDCAFPAAMIPAILTAIAIGVLSVASVFIFLSARTQ